MKGMIRYLFTAPMCQKKADLQQYKVLRKQERAAVAEMRCRQDKVETCHITEPGWLQSDDPAGCVRVMLGCGSFCDVRMFLCEHMDEENLKPCQQKCAFAKNNAKYIDSIRNVKQARKQCAEFWAQKFTQYQK